MSRLRHHSMSCLYIDCPFVSSIESVDWAPSSSVPIAEKLDQSLTWSLPFSHQTTSHMDSTWRRYFRFVDTRANYSRIQMLFCWIYNDQRWIIWLSSVLFNTCSKYIIVTKITTTMWEHRKVFVSTLNFRPKDNIINTEMNVSSLWLFWSLCWFETKAV